MNVNELYEHITKEVEIEDARKPGQYPVAEGKVPDPKAQTGDKISDLVESRGFALLDLKEGALLKNDEGKVQTFPGLREAKAYVKENKLEGAVRVIRVNEAGSMAMNPKLKPDTQQGNLPGQGGGSKVRKVSGSDKQPGTPPKEAPATRSQAAGKGAGAGSEKSQRKNLKDSKEVREWAERAVLVVSLKEKAKETKLSEREQSFIDQMESVEFDDASRAKVEEMAKEMYGKMKKGKKKKDDK